jgi:hypothetical protein
MLVQMKKEHLQIVLARIELFQFLREKPNNIKNGEGDIE